jgi:anthranilate synthase/phosphoribosyltransferase
MKILVIDNFDSFTYNLVDFFRQLGSEVTVFRNTIEPEALDTHVFDLMVLSPGPSVPRNAGNLMAIIGRFYQHKPMLGVCLGHQALIEFFGGSLANIAPVHGKSVPIQHDGRGIFTGIEQGCHIARYHSWAGRDIPHDFEVSARSEDGTVMAIRHKKLPIEGIQFHPESVLSMKNQTGMRMLRNVIEGRLAAGNRVYHAMMLQLQSGEPIGQIQYESFFKAVSEGQLSDDQKLILLTALSQSLKNAPSLYDFISALKPDVALPAIENSADAMDICGTGGSGLPRINTSTLAALLLAHHGLKIAKHGNKAAAGRYGSFNLLEDLGVSLRFDPKKAAKSLEDNHLAFVFAPDVYPVFKHFAPIRNKIGIPTVFNVLGPLINPYKPKRQFIGTAFADMMEVIFETAILMGKSHVIVVRGSDGLDEISASTSTRVLEYKGGKRYDYVIHPEDFGIERIDYQELATVNPAESLEIAQAILKGVPATAHYQLVAINAAFIYAKFVVDMNLKTAYSLMEKCIFEGAMGEVLENYNYTQCKIS